VKPHIVQEPDPVLREVALPVLKKDITSRKIASLIARMKELLKKEEFGVAIAAPQVGVSLRIFVIAGKAFATDENRKGFEEDESAAHYPHMVFINPRLTRLSKKMVELSEGCLSVRGKYGTVMRHEKASIEALDEKGKRFTYHGSGLIGHIFQHECDHLEGILYTDKVVKLEEDDDLAGARKKLKEKHHV
jgi:peptide deformylase